MSPRKPAEPRVRVFDEAGNHVVNPTRQQVAELIAALCPGNGYLVVELLGPTGQPTDDFTQAAIPRTGSDEWIVEYREGKRQFRAMCADGSLVADALGEYANAGATWRDNLEWSLFLTHGRVF